MGTKGLEMNKYAVSAADVELFRASQRGDEDGQMVGPF